MNDQEQSVKTPLVKLSKNSESILFYIIRYYMTSWMFCCLCYLDDHHCNSDYDDSETLSYDYDVSCSFDAIINNMEQNARQTNSFLGSQFKHGTYTYIYIYMDELQLYCTVSRKKSTKKNFRF